MRKQAFWTLMALAVLAGPAAAQSILFDFDTAPQHASLPIDLTVGGVTAHFSATGQGYSIQSAGTMGFTPVGFAGLCIYPNSVYAADLIVSFVPPLHDLSIMYAPQELACDTSATMRITAYMDGAFVATTTTTAPTPGTWPTGLLTIGAGGGFNSVVIHYDAPPPGCTDYGPIFMADNMTVSPMLASDLAIAATDGQTTAIPGQAVTYTIIVSNAGPTGATGATVTDTAPLALVGATWTCVAAGGGQCAASGTGNISDTVNLPMGATATYTLTGTVSPAATGSLTNTASVATAPGGPPDLNLANNSATDTDTLTPVADLSVTVSDQRATAFLGQPVTYSIFVANAGPSAVSGATVVDAVPVALAGAGWTCAATGSGSCAASGTGSIDDAVSLPVGAVATYTLTGIVSAAATGDLSNTATVAAPAGVSDPSLGNNSATDTDTLAVGISIGDSTVTQDTSASVPAAFLVSLSVASGQVVTVDYATADGTATAGHDYATTSGTLVFAPGTTTQAVSVSVMPETLSEATESYFVNLSNATSGGIARGQGVGTILNTVPPPSLSIDDVSVDEGPLAKAIFTVALSTASGSSVSVRYATLDGTAVAGLDYVATSGTLVFPPGATTQTIAVSVRGDATLESTKDFFVSLSAPTSAVLSRARGECWILDNVAGQRLQFSSATYTVSELGKKAVITVKRSGGATGAVSVDYDTSDGTAASGVKYTAVSGTLTFGPGVVSRTFAVPILNESAVEGDETILLSLTNARGGAALGTPSSAVLTILDDDVAEAIAFGAANYSASQAGGQATITVRRQGPTGSTVGVTYATAPGTAVPSVDYADVSGTLAFPPGAVSATFKVPLLNDTLAEGDRTVLLSLASPTGGAALGTPSTAVLTILDKDVAGAFRFGAAAYTVKETAGHATITVARNGGASGVTVTYATSGGTAIPGTDYTATSGVLSFGAGVTTQSFTVPIANTGPKGDQTVGLTLASPTGGATLGAQSTALLTIQGGQTQLQFGAPSFTVSEVGHLATITVKRTGPAAKAVSVDYATSDGTASAVDGDYTATKGTLAFGPNVLSKIFTVPVSDDGLLEGNETVNLALSNPTPGAFLGLQHTAVLTIVTDDPALQFTQPSTTVSELAGKATITVTRKPPTKPAVTVEFASSDGTAVAGTDYVATSGTLSFASGVVNRTFSVPILRDTAQQGNRTVNLTLSNPLGGAILGAPASAALTISDQDVAGTLQFAVADFSVSETGPLASIVVTRTGGLASDVTVDYATADGTALAGIDYVATSGTLTFGYKETSQTFAVRVLDDALSGGNLTVNLTLGNAQGGAKLGLSSATLWIVENR